MTTLAIARSIKSDALPPGAVGVRPGGLLSHVRRPCGAHQVDAYCVGRSSDGSGLVYWCAEGRHHLSSPRESAGIRRAA